MAKRQKEWARRTRDHIFDQLGRQCVDCGSEDKLEFDVIIPVGNDRHHRAMDWSHRMSFYRHQLDQNNLAVRCKECNAKKKNKLVLQPELRIPDCPF